LRKEELAVFRNVFGCVNKNKTNKEFGPTFKSFIVELSGAKRPLTKKY
jgi:hypothetical protein